MRLIVTMTALLVAPIAGAAMAQDAPYVQHEDIVYGEEHGVGLLMDVFTPTASTNGLAIVDVISGGWHSDRGKIRDHARALTFDILCRKGYTVFAVRPGSVTKFSVPEMLVHLNQGIRWVKAHSGEYAIAPDRLGLMGASAGGHLACLAAVTASDPATDAATAASGSEAAGKSDAVPSTSVKAVAVFFPPTDFLNFGDKPVDARATDGLGALVRRLAFPEGLADETDEEVTRRLTQISPARLVTSSAPPFLLIHGDADPVVPLQQSEAMLAALKKAGVPAELIVKKGGGHPWLTIPLEVKVLADWFDEQLDAE